jgi:hypothetical protein
MTERLRWLGFFLLLVLDPAGGATLTGLYEAEVSISNRDSAHETQAMEEALRAVLLKLSSDRNAATRTEIARVLEEVRDYVQHLQYREVVAGPLPGLKLWVQFDRKALDKGLRESQLPLWEQDRPSILIWLMAVEEGGARRLIGAGDPTGYIDILQSRAAARGLPVFLPLLDLEDEIRVKIDEGDEGLNERIFEASSRYGADAVLLGRLTRLPEGGFQAQWNLSLPGRILAWSAQGERPEPVLEAGIDDLIDRLATPVRRGVPSKAGSLALIIEEVYNLDHYERVQHYLKSLKEIESVTVKQIEPERVVFLVIARGGGSEAVAEAIAKGDVLQPLTPEEGRYRLVAE